MTEELKTQPIPKVYPFNRDTVRLITGDPELVLSKARLSICEVCSRLPDSAELNSRQGGLEAGVPDVAARLADHVEIRTSLRLLKCPTCGCLYKLERHSEFLSGPGEASWTLTRLQAGDAYELLLGQPAKAVLRRDQRWLLEW